jgi:Ras-related protein Rab-2A
METPAPTQRHIMIVDDDERLVREIARALSDRKEFQVHAFTLGEIALHALRQIQFDLVIADWHMPNVDGIALIREAQERSPETVTVLMTAYGITEAKAQNEATLAHHYLEKPFSIEDLVSVIDTIFPARALRDKQVSRVLKVVLGGDANVGKTSLIHRYCTGEFDPSREMTIGVDFHLYDVEIQDEPIRLVVWDLGGQERFASARQAFYRGTQAVGLVFDASNRTSFYNLMRWWRETHEYLPAVPVLLLANKTDLPRQISDDEAKQIAEAWSIQFFESSCADGTGVTEFFDALAQNAWKHAQQTQTSDATK